MADQGGAPPAPQPQPPQAVQWPPPTPPQAVQRPGPVTPALPAPAHAPGVDGDRPPDPSVLAARPPVAGGPQGPRRRRWPAVLVGLLLSLLLAACAGLVVTVRQLEDRLSAQRRAEAADARRADERLAAGVAATNGLAERLGALETKVGDQPDLPKVASAVQPSVFTIRTAAGLGSGFVLQSAAGHSTLVTNFHVVEDAWRTPAHEVSVVNESHQLVGTIQRVVEAQDLAVVDVTGGLPALERATTAPKVGDPVLAIGSPLGLAGSASSGIVSAVRSGTIQFSAPVSPGNSGGPVVDRRGRVLGVTTSKLVGNGAEGLSFAIPVDTVCSSLGVC